MQSTASRRAGTSLFTFLNAQSCRASERCMSSRASSCISTSNRQQCYPRHVSSRYRGISTSPAASPSQQPTATQTPRQQPAVQTPKTPSVVTTSSSKPPSEPAPNTATRANAEPPQQESEPLRSLTDGLDDPPPYLSEDEKQVDWTRSYHGLSSTPFTPEQADILQAPIPPDDIEIKPDGIIYLPEIKYRRILNRAFGPGGWGLAPRGETIVTSKVVTREYGLVCHGRLVSLARGEQAYFDPDGIPTATEGCKSNALMRCCKDLGIASELWDPRFIKRFLADMSRELFVEHQTTRKRRKHFMRRDDELKYPWKEVSATGSTSATGSAGAAARR